MAEIVNLASFVGTAGQELSAADANWTQTYQGGTGIGTISDAARVYQSASSEAVYVRSEAPGSANQTVTATIRQVASLASGNHAGVVARKQSDVNTYITGVLRSESGGRQIRAYKVVGGTATQIGTSAPVTTANGTDYALQLEVTGQSPNLRIVVKLDGTTHIDQTINDTNLDAAGSVGIRFGFGTSASTNTAGLHIASFSASDDTGAVTPVTFSGSVANQTGTEGAAFSLNLSTYFSGSETPFAYSVQSGTLPAGLSLNSSTGVISGTPTTAGTYASLQVRATDAGSLTADSNAFTITVAVPGGDGTITVGSALYPIKYSSASVLNESGLRATVLDATTLAQVLNTSGVVCTNGVITITDAALVIGGTYHLAVKTASGWTGLSDAVTAS